MALPASPQPKAHSPQQATPASVSQGSDGEGQGSQGSQGQGQKRPSIRTMSGDKNLYNKVYHRIRQMDAETQAKWKVIKAREEESPREFWAFVDYILEQPSKAQTRKKFES